MKRLFLILCAIGVFNARADDSPALFRYESRIEVSEPKEGMLAIPLGEPILRRANREWSDLRLEAESDPGPTEIPFLLEKVERRQDGKPAVSIRTRVIDASELSEGILEMENELLDKKLNAATLRIDTPLSDFEKKVDVSGSNDGNSWQSVLENALILDRSNFLDFRRTSLTLPDNDYRFFRIRISAATDEQVASLRKITVTTRGDLSPTRSETTEVKTRPFRVDKIAFLTKGAKESSLKPKERYDVEIVSQTFDPEKKETTIEFSAGNLPLDGLDVSTKAQNFRRKYRLETAETDEWHQRSNGFLHSYSIGSLQDDGLEISFLETRSEKWRLVIEQGDNPPVEVESITGLGEPYRLLTLGGEESLTLYFGADPTTVSKPNYDTAALELARKKNLPVQVATAGPPTENEAFAAVETPGEAWYQSKTVLWAAIALVVLAMLWVLLGASKKIGAMEE